MAKPQTSSPSSDNSTPLSGSQLEIRKILRSFTLDPEGIISLGKDGVLRSLDADRNVLNAASLKPRLIKAFLDRMSWTKEAEDTWRGVDGTKTPESRWYSPEEGMLPPPLAVEHRLTEAQKEEARTILKEREKRRAEEEEGMVSSGCPVVVSDHDLGLDQGKEGGRDE